MTTLRARSGFLGDARFLTGLALVLVSVAGVWWVLTSARQSAPVLQAVRTIVVGDVLSSADFRVVDAGLGAASANYLAPDDPVPGMIAARTIADGELVPVSAVADAGTARRTSIVVESVNGLPGSVAAGSRVEVWAAPADPERRTFGEPRVLLQEATVAEISENSSMLGRSGTAVELVVARSEVSALLSAVTGGAAISVIPLGVPSPVTAGPESTLSNDRVPDADEAAEG